jgi:hypothetical protein
MYEVTNIPFGNIEVDVEAETFLDMMVEVDMVKNLGQDAELVEDHVRFFHDEEPRVRPRFSDDDDGNTYYGFICENTGVNITFKIDQDGGIYPGRYAAYENGNSNSKLYDPRLSTEEILSQVDENTDFIRKHGVRLSGAGGGGQGNPRGQQQPQGNPRGGRQGQQQQSQPSPRGGGQSRGGGQGAPQRGRNQGNPGQGSQGAPQSSQNGRGGQGAPQRGGQNRGAPGR